MSDRIPEAELRKMLKLSYGFVYGQWVRVVERLLAVEEENERLREALKPFAECFAKCGLEHMIDSPINTHSKALVPTIGDCRRAAEVLK